MQAIEKITQLLQIGGALTINATNGRCTLVRIPIPFGSAPLSIEDDFSGVTKAFGPFGERRSYRIECVEGSITYSQTTPVSTPENAFAPTYTKPVEAGTPAKVIVPAGSELTIPASPGATGEVIINGVSTPYTGGQLSVPASKGLRSIIVRLFTGTAIATTAWFAGVVTPVPTISFSSAADVVAEGDSGTKIVTNTLNVVRNGVTGALVVNLAAGGSATAGSDYVALPTSVTIPTGADSVSFPLTVNGDTTVETNETVVINAVLAAYASATAQRVVTITNDDVATTTPTISFANTTVSVAEGNSGTTTVTNTITAVRNGITGALQVNLSTGGTATAGTDYVALPASVTIPAGSDTVAFDLLVNGDTTVETNETVIINAVLAAYSSVTAQKTITITNDDVTADAAIPAPVSDWRMPATVTLSDSADATSVATMQETAASKARTTFGVPANSTRSITYQVGASTEALLLTYYAIYAGTTAVVETSTDNLSWVDAGFTKRFPSGEDSGIRRQFCLIPAGGARYIRLSLTTTSNSDTIQPLLHKMPVTGKPDTWLIVGASREAELQNGRALESAVAAAYPTRDPLIFNYAVGGAMPNQIQAYTASGAPAYKGIVSYAYLSGSMLGNGVSDLKPYTASQQSTFTGYFNSTFTALANNDMIVCPGNISFRAYNIDSTYLNQDAGSLPYNVNVVEPVIQSRAPEFFDTIAQRARIDEYLFVLRDRANLEDSTHGSDVADANVRAHKIDTLFRFIYTGAWPASQIEQRVAAVETSKTDTNYYEATYALAALVASSGKTNYDNRIKATISAPVNTVAPTLDGSFAVGGQASVNAGTWTAFPTPAYTYQLTLDGAEVAGATTALYTFVAADQGKVPRSRVTATNPAGTLSVTTAAGPAVAAAGAGGYDAASTALFQRMTVQPSNAAKTAMDNLMRVVKTLNRDQFVMYAAHTQQAALLNWANSAVDHSLPTSGTLPGFTPFRGFNGSGAAGGQIETNRAPSTFGNYAINDASVGFYLFSTGLITLFGTEQTSTGTYPLYVVNGNASNDAVVHLNNGANVSVPTFAAGIGHVITRRLSTEFSITTGTAAAKSYAATAVTSLTSFKTRILRSGSSYASSGLGMSCWHVGPALTSAQEQALNTAIANYRTATNDLTA